MKNKILYSKMNFISFLTLIISTIAIAQETISFISPEIHQDNKVTFRFFAPNAKEVILTGECWKIQSHSELMKKDEKGLWTLTIGPLEADIYAYSFIVDGNRVLDQDNGWIKPGVRITENMFLVPGEQAEFLMESSVPHGEVRMVYYQSSVLNKVKRMHVYFPPGYGSGDERYPVLYLLHGGGDYDDGWISIGKANIMLDNLIAEGKTKPMIVVMPSIWAIDPPLSADQRDENSDLMSKSLIQDIIPFIEHHYRALTEPENRAIGGLSLPNILPHILFSNIEKFNYVGFTSNGLTSTLLESYDSIWPGKLTNQENTKRIQVWIGDGSNARTYPRSKYAAEIFQDYGYQTTFYETDGIHAWPWFRRYFAEFSKHLFQ